MIFQSTLPRGERRRICRQSTSTHKISIHAPARGATGRDSYSCEYILYFNPRSREGSDTPCFAMYAQSKKFQSTLPRGERPAERYRVGVADSDFNPRSREGSDTVEQG